MNANNSVPHRKSPIAALPNLKHAVLAIIGLVLLAKAIMLLAGISPALMPGAALPMDPLSVVDAFHHAINDVDVDTLLVLFADDALVIDNRSVFEGEALIRDWVKDLHMPARLHLEMIDYQVDGERVFWYDKANNEPGSEFGFYILRWKAVIREGKIISLAVSFLPMPDGK